MKSRHTSKSSGQAPKLTRFSSRRARYESASEVLKKIPPVNFGYGTLKVIESDLKDNSFFYLWRAHFIATQVIKLNHCVLSPLPDLPGRWGGVLGLMFAGYVSLASQSPYPIIVYFWANYRPHLSHVLENVIFAIST